MILMNDARLSLIRLSNERLIDNLLNNNLLSEIRIYEVMAVKIKVKALREATTYTQRQVADFLGVTESNYRRLENNHIKSISLETIDFLCNFFKCLPNDIFEIVMETHES